MSIEALNAFAVATYGPLIAGFAAPFLVAIVAAGFLAYFSKLLGE